MIGHHSQILVTDKIATITVATNDVILFVSLPKYESKYLVSRMVHHLSVRNIEKPSVHPVSLKLRDTRLSKFQSMY